MVAQLAARLGEQFHLGALTQRRKRIAALSWTGERVHPRPARDAEFPLELFVMRFQIVIGHRPIDDVVTHKVGAGSFGIAALYFIGVKLEVARHINATLALSNEAARRRAH